MDFLDTLEKQLIQYNIYDLKHRGLYYHHSFFTKEEHFAEFKINEIDFIHPQKPLGSFEVVITFTNNTNTSFFFSRIFESVDAICNQKAEIIVDAKQKYRDYLNNLANGVKLIN